MSTPAKTDKPVNNGVNVEALLGAREALEKAPEAAQFKWRSTVKWINGTHSRSTIETFYGLGGEQKHRQPFTFDGDHPEVFASEDKGATPVEMVLATAKGQKTFLRGGTEAEVNKYFEEATFKETTLLPNQTYRGVMFFAVPAQKKRGMDRFFTSWSVYTESGPKVRVGVTNLDSGERVLFAPFPIKLPENAGAFSY